MKKLLAIVLIFVGAMSLAGTANAQHSHGSRFGVSFTFGHGHSYSHYRHTPRVIIRPTYIRRVCPPPVVYHQPVYRPVYQPRYITPRYHTPCWSGYAAGHRHWNPQNSNPHTHGYFRAHQH